MSGITFRPELAAAVIAGTKTVTRRLCTDNPRSPWWRERCAFQLGRAYAVQPGRGKPAIGRAVIVAVDRQPLGVLTDTETRREGFLTREAFEEAFAAINGRYDPAAEVWRVELHVEPCDLCHGTPATRVWKGRRVCAGCADAGDYYDSLTPAELWAEEESMARYVTETATWGEG